MFLPPATAIVAAVPVRTCGISPSDIALSRISGLVQPLSDMIINGWPVLDVIVNVSSIPRPV